jgi:rhomboid protease GluP
MDKRRMCPHCRAFITANDRVCPYCSAQVGPRAIDARHPSDILGGFIPHARFTTSILLLINCGLFAVTLALSMGTASSNALLGIDGPTLYRLGAKWRVFETGQWWRLVTAGFLHGGVLHILMNSWVLFDVGAQVEEIFGAARMVVIYLAASVAGFFLSSMWSDNLSVGASAGIMGLIGAMIALGVRHRSNPAAVALRGMYIRWVIYMLVLGFLIPFIDQAAHIGGLAGGFCVAYVAGTPKLADAIRERFWRVAALVAVALTVAAFVMMLQSATRT